MSNRESQMINTYIEAVEKRVSEVTGEAVGYASMCWIPKPGNQVFDSAEALKAADMVMGEIKPLAAALRVAVGALEFLDCKIQDFQKTKRSHTEDCARCSALASVERILSEGGE